MDFSQVQTIDSAALLYLMKTYRSSYPSRTGPPISHYDKELKGSIGSDFAQFIQRLKSKTGIDLALYKESQDPECMTNEPSVERLNGAACHSCSMVSETDCENGNRLLDRKLVVPLPIDNECSYFNELVKELCGMEI